MNERCQVAISNPIARADSGAAPMFWRRLVVDGRWLSSIVTVNK